MPPRWLWVLALSTSGCGLGVGVEGTGSVYPQASIALTVSDATPAGFGEFYIRRYVQRPLFTEVGLGGAWFVTPRVWRWPVPLPAIGLLAGIQKWDGDTSRLWITGLFGQVGIEWILWRPFHVAPGEIPEGHFLWFYLRTYAKTLYQFPRSLLPSLGVEMGFRIHRVSSL